jgi:hypothetical protein
VLHGLILTGFSTRFCDFNWRIYPPVLEIFTLTTWAFACNYLTGTKTAEKDNTF